VRRAILEWLAPILLILSPACSTVAKVQPGEITMRADVREAVRTAWVDVYGESIGTAPVVFLVEGDSLTCTQASGLSGFECPGAGCVGGCTSNQFAVSVVPRRLWAESTLPHELLHAKKIKLAIWYVNTSPETAVKLLLENRNHAGPDWEPGGLLDKATSLMNERGQ
jgi:hypothetical protein